MVEWAARALAAEGRTRIALYGAGRHTLPITRNPWQKWGASVVVVLDDNPRTDWVAGVPVKRPADWLEARNPAFDALVVSSETYEALLARSAEQALGDALRTAHVPIVRLYRAEDEPYDEPAMVERLVRDHAVAPEHARWLVENRDERHDATLPMIRADRREFHLRRYELAANLLRTSGGSRAADVACGTGYGAGLLTTQGGAASYIGIDIDPHAVEYARARYATRDGIEFRCAPGETTGIDAQSVDLVASFESIEHIPDTDALVAEYARILKHDGLLVVSTPNELGPTPYHVHDFSFRSFEAALQSRFAIEAWYGQLPEDTVHDPELPPGVFALDLPAARAGEPDARGRKPHVLIAVCRPLPEGASAGDLRRVRTGHGMLLLRCPNDLSAWRAETFAEKEPETLEWIDAFDPGDVFWDIGANVGLYALYAAQAGIAARVLAFEPSPWNIAMLADHARLNGFSSVVGVYPLALSDTTGPGTLFMRHVTPSSAGSSFAEPVGEFGETFAPAHEQAAMGVRADDLVAWGLPTPNRIKIDVDGAEERVLDGARETLRADALKSVSIELDASRDDLIERVTRRMSEAGLALVAKRHAEGFATGQNASLFNFRFDRDQGGSR